MNGDEIFEIIHHGIQNSSIPGASVALGHLHDVQFGHFGTVSSQANAQAVTLETIYDLASLTKVLTTTTLFLSLIEYHHFDPNAALGTMLPELSGHDLESTTVLELASHTSGLAAFSRLRDWGLTRDAALKRAVLATRVNPIGSLLYSDVGFIVLGALLERLTNLRLDVLANNLFKPLGLGLTFHPQIQCCATTEFVPERGGFIHGVVHDENALALGGIAGHAGLFGSVLDVAGFATALLDEQIISKACLEFMTIERAKHTTDRRGFGWVLQHQGWSGGDAAPRTTLGHTGFTGTGLWLDPVSKRFVVLLTNRVDPSRHTNSGIIALRKAVGDAFWSQ